MAAITSYNVAIAIAKYIAARALPPLIGNLVMGNLVNRDFEPVLANGGDTVNIPIPPVMVANNIAEGGSVVTQNPSPGSAQITLNTHAEATFQIPDVTRALAQPNLIDLYMGPAVNALAEKIETDLLSLWPLFTINAPLGGTSAMDEARVDTAERVLFDQKVPQAQKFMVVASTSASAMRQIPRFTEYQTMGPVKGDAIANAGLPGYVAGGLFGNVKDFMVFRSQYVSLSTNYKNLAFQRNAIGFAMRRLPQPLPGTGALAEYAELGNFGMRVVMSYQPNTLAQQFTIDVLYGAAVLRNTHGVVVQSN